MGANYMHQNSQKSKPIPTPGVEPGPPGWKPGILAVRLRGILMDRDFRHSLLLKHDQGQAVYKY